MPTQAEEQAQDLRQRAKSQWQAQDAVALSPDLTPDTVRLIQELEIHQIELEIQNEELIRARNQAEAAHRQYVDLYDFAPVGYLTLTERGTIVHANLTTTSLLGQPRAQLIDRPFAHFVAPVSRSSFSLFMADLFAKAEAGQNQARTELRLHTAKSDQPSVHVEATVEGKHCHVALVDISARVQREQELSTIASVSLAMRSAITPQEITDSVLTHLLSAMQMNGVALAMLDQANGQHLIIGAVGAFAPSQHSLLTSANGMVNRAILHRMPILSDEANSRDAVERPLVFQSEKWLICVPLIVTEQVIGTLWLGRQLPIVPSQIDLLTSIADIVAIAIQRVTLFSEVNAHAQRLAQILANVPVGILLLDEQLRLVQANPAAEMILDDLADDQESGQTKHPASDPVGDPAQSHVGEYLDRLGPCTTEDLIHASSTGAWQEIRTDSRIFGGLATTLRAAGEASGWVLLLRDITDEQQLRQQLARQDRLAAVGQLAAGIAHDFNNILAVISLYAELIVRPPELPPRKQEQATIIRNQVDHAAHLVQQILDFSGRAVLRLGPLDLLALAESQAELLTRTLVESSKFRVTAAPAEYTIWADPTRMQQLIMNIALNAQDAMPEGGHLTLDLARLDVTEDQIDDEKLPPILRAKAAAWIRLTFTDTGTGIPQHDLAHVFEPFFTTKGPDKGTGLGLAQVHGIVTQHQGHIDLQSQMGQGTTITIYLPALAETPKLAPAAPFPAPMMTGGDKTVLVVEDNPALAAALFDMLESWDYSVLTATDGVAALALVAQTDTPIHLVISDVIMPHMGGVTLLHTLRDRGWHMPVLLMSGHPLQKEQMADLHGLGASAWLRKPFSMEELAQIMTTLTAPDAP